MAKLAWILCTNLPTEDFRNLGVVSLQDSELPSRSLFMYHLWSLLSAPTAACHGQMYQSHQSPTSEEDDKASLSHTFLCGEWTEWDLKSLRIIWILNHLNKNKKLVTDLRYTVVLYSMSCHLSTHTTETYLSETHFFYVLDERVSAPEIFSNMLKTKQQAYWHDKCESFCLKLLAITCSWLL